MTTFFLYLMKSVLCLTLFYPFYMVLLSRETFHRFNRMALLSILLASVAIPACRITTEEPMLLSQLYQRWEHWLTGQEETPTATFEIDWAAMEYATTTVVESDMLQLEPTFSLGDFLSQHWGDLLFAIYLLGIVFLLVRHTVSLVRLFGLLRKGKMQRLDNGVRLYLHPHADVAPFSWMKYIVISEADYRENGHQIVTHEQAHISNHHSWDLLLTEVCLLGQWFNPAAWLLRQELQNIHEYEADETVLRHGINAKEYQLLIIKKAVGARLYSLANSLNHSSLKKRLTMMMKEKSHPWARLKYLYVLPLAAISMVAFAHTEAANNSNGISEAKGTEVLANNQIPGVESSENEKVLIVVDGKLTIQNAAPADWANKGFANLIGVTPDEIAQMEVIKEPEILAQWNIPGATGAVLVTTKKANKQTFDVTPLENGEKGFKINSSKDSKVIIVLDGKVASVETGLTRFRSNETLADGLGIKSEDITGIEVITNPDLLAQWNIPDAAGAILVSTKNAKSTKEHFTVHVNNAGEYSYGPMGGTLKKGSLEDIYQYIYDVREKLQANGGGQYFTVNVKVGKNTPMESVEKLKNTLRKAWALRITYGLMEDEKAVVSHLKLNGQARLNEDTNVLEVDGNAEEVFQVVEDMPEFPGGNTELMKYLAKNINYPAEAQQKGEQGRVIVQFVVGKDGNLRDFKVVKSVSPELDAEAIRVCKAMPKWQPGTQRGQAVAVKYTIPISFRLQDKDSDDKSVASDMQVVSVTKANNEGANLPKQSIKDSDGDEVFQVVENMPEFPGGMAELMKFLQQNIKYPEQAQKDSIQGRVIVQFVINKMGQVTDPTIMRGVSPELDAEALRVTNAMPLWTPGKQKDKAVNVKFTLPITFKLNAPETAQK